MPPFAMFQYPRQEDLHAPERAPEIDIHHSSPLLVGHVKNQPTTTNTCVVTENMNIAELSFRSICRGLYGFSTGEWLLVAGRVPPSPGGGFPQPVWPGSPSLGGCLAGWTGWLKPN